MKVDEFLAQQQNAGVEFLATIEPVFGKPDRVKVTPYSAARGCGCSRSFELSATDIESVDSTGKTVWCCGKQLRIAKVTVRRSATMPIHDVVGMITQRLPDDPHGSCVRNCRGRFHQCQNNPPHPGYDCGKELEDCLATCPDADPG